MKKILSLFIPALLPVVLMVACEGDLTRPGQTATYRVETMLVKRLPTGAAHLDLTFIRNGSYYKKADITLAGIALDTSVCGYCKDFTPAQIAVDSCYILNIKDSTFLNINLTISLPGAFSIDGPSLRNFIGNAEPVAWTISDGTDGYILATKPPESAGTSDGYEDYVSGITGAIPPETFILNINDRIVGTHMIYVASYIGAPVDFPSLLFDIPTASNPADNVSYPIITGRTAGMVIAAPDSIIVSE